MRCKAAEGARARRLGRRVRALPAVLGADVLDPETGPRARWSVELSVEDDRGLPPAVARELAVAGATIAVVQPQGDHHVAVAVV